jgi:hypothetical protein
MDGRNEKRFAIKFCFKASLSATETLVLVQEAYGNEALNRSNIFRWYSRFRDVRGRVDDERGGRPKSTRTVVVPKEFVSEGKTVNVEFYKGVLDRLLKRIQRIRPAAFCSQEFFLFHDNAPAHKAASVYQFLTQNIVTTLYHPPYSPDLSLRDYFLFPKLKMKL